MKKKKEKQDDGEVPEKYLPTEELPHVDIPEQRLDIGEQSRDEAAKQLGMMTVSKDVISTLERIGLDIDTLGTIKVANGFCFLSQQAVLLCISKISEAVQTGTNAADVASAMSKLANAMTNSAKAMKIGGWQKQQLPQKPAIEIGFTPGRRIKLNDPKAS